VTESKTALSLACALLLTASLVGGCSKAPNRTVSQGPTPVGMRISAVKGDGLTVLTMPLPDAQLGWGLGIFRLSKLDGGCVVAQSAKHRADPRAFALVWPSGTVVKSDGSIRSSLGEFRLGQIVTGGALGKWQTDKLDVSTAVASLCPVSTYLQLGSLTSRDTGADGRT